VSEKIAPKKSGMLVLTRKPGEYVRITVPPSQEPTQISVCLVDVAGSRTRIGFLAPKDSIIGREELYQARPPVAEAVTETAA
jgi:carbon storage regulator CsrA